MESLKKLFLSFNLTPDKRQEDPLTGVSTDPDMNNLYENVECGEWTINVSDTTKFSQHIQQFSVRNYVLPFMQRSQNRSKRYTTTLLRRYNTSTVLCKVPLINISISAITCNIAIAIIIFQRRKNIINTRICYFLFSLVAIDLIYSSFIILIIMMSIAQSTTPNNIQRPKRTDAPVRSLTISFTHIQLCTQTAIAVERAIADKFSLLY